MATAPFSPFAPMMQASPASYASNPDSVHGPVAVRRRPNQMQGQALEILGHAIEYLVDSRVVNIDGNRIEYNRDAVALLSKSSREIFDGCEAVVPLGDRLKSWLYGPSAKAA